VGGGVCYCARGDVFIESPGEVRESWPSAEPWNFLELRSSSTETFLPPSFIRSHVSRCHITDITSILDHTCHSHYLTMVTPQVVRRWVLTGSIAAIAATGAIYGAGLRSKQEYNRVCPFPIFVVVHPQSPALYFLLYLHVHPSA
jgi:hypothetical protein